MKAPGLDRATKTCRRVICRHFENFRQYKFALFCTAFHMKMFDMSLALGIFFLAAGVTGAQSALNSRGEATVASEESVLTVKDVSVADSYAQPSLGAARRQITARFLVIAAAAAMALIYTIISCFSSINKRGTKAGMGLMLRRLAEEGADQCSVGHLRVVHDDSRSRFDR